MLARFWWRWRRATRVVTDIYRRAQLMPCDQRTAFILDELVAAGFGRKNAAAASVSMAQTPPEGSSLGIMPELASAFG